MLLLDSSHSFPVSGPLELTLQSIYGTAAAALSLLAAEVADWGEGSVQPACKPAAALLQVCALRRINQTKRGRQKAVNSCVCGCVLAYETYKSG